MKFIVHDYETMSVRLGTERDHTLAGCVTLLVEEYCVGIFDADDKSFTIYATELAKLGIKLEICNA